MFLNPNILILVKNAALMLCLSLIIVVVRVPKHVTAHTIGRATPVRIQCRVQKEHKRACGLNSASMAILPRFLTPVCLLFETAGLHVL